VRTFSIASAIARRINSDDMSVKVPGNELALLWPITQSRVRSRAQDCSLLEARAGESPACMK
jgi:hypothetical protein